jgi:hypothetical protein
MIIETGEMFVMLWSDLSCPYEKKSYREGKAVGE